jgi:NAD(P)-dependent dehydrogenase (short-subunit alcohol dehydrogenase family)
MILVAAFRLGERAEGRGNVTQADYAAIGLARLQDKVAVVTGAGSRAAGFGTGRAAAVLFARHGARVLVVDRDRAAAQLTVALIEAEGGIAEAHVADITSADSCHEVADHAVSTWGRLDILDNNIGVEGAGTILDADWQQWDAVMTVNVKTIALASAAALPYLSRNGGSIINISSISAFRPRGLTPYSTAKGAVIALTRAMAVDHAGSGVRVNCIAPGPIYTPMVYAAGMSAQLRERRKKASLLGIEGTAWDVAQAAVFLASDEARYITGVVLPVDGGVSLRSPER